MQFVKMHGLGNDYVYVNTIKEPLRKPERIAKIISDRHRGIGADGLILVGRSRVADFSMDMYNADGSRSEMCGNGIRCVAKYVYDKKLTTKKRLSIETLSGVKYVNLIVEKDQVNEVEVNMGKPWFAEEEQLLNLKDKEHNIRLVSMGNPHAVLFVDDVEKFAVNKIGPEIEKHELFPNRVNVEFCQVIDRKTMRVRVWERGSGETLACGTGACASAVVGVLNNLTEPEITIKLLGGDLKVKWDRRQNRVFMKGPAVTVFDGSMNIDL